MKAFAKVRVFGCPYASKMFGFHLIYRIFMTNLFDSILQRIMFFLLDFSYIFSAKKNSGESAIARSKSHEGRRACYKNVKLKSAPTEAIFFKRK